MGLKDGFGKEHAGRTRMWATRGCRQQEEADRQIRGIVSGWAQLGELLSMAS